MKKQWVFVTGLSILFFVGCQTLRGSGGGEFSVKGLEEQRLPNGLKIVWIPDATLPYVSMNLLVASGSASDPKDRPGTAQMVSQMLDKGTASRDALRISESLDQIGAEFAASASVDYTQLSISMLSFNKNKGLELFQDILLEPTFPKRELERERKNVLAGLTKMADRPETFSDFVMTEFFYGKDHPYGHESIGDRASVQKISTKDLTKFYERNYVPNNAILAVVGRFDEGWRAKVLAAFNAWPTRKVEPIQWPEFPKWNGAKVLIVDRSDLNQAQIRISMQGVRRNVPEYLEIRAALKILGESFGSRLFEEVREKRGLTYGIYSFFEPRFETGPISIYTFTRVDKIKETVEVTLETYRNFVEKGVTDQEVKVVKALMRGQFPRMMETPEALANQFLILKRYGIAEEYLTDHFKLIDRMSTSSINAAIKKYFTPSDLKILVYAPKEPAEAALKGIGDIEVKAYKSYLR